MCRFLVAAVVCLLAAAVAVSGDVTEHRLDCLLDGKQ